MEVEVEADALVAVAPVAEAVELMELLVEEAAAVKLAGLRWPQLLFSFWLQRA